MTFLHFCEFLRVQSEESFHVETPAEQSSGNPMEEMQARLAGVRGAPRMPRTR